MLEPYLAHNFGHYVPLTWHSRSSACCSSSADITLIFPGVAALPAIAKMEKWTDMYLSTLRSHIKAMGGQLEIVARFPEGAVQISNFAELGETAAT